MANPKVATIVPKSHLDEIQNDEYMMALSYALTDTTYLHFFVDSVIKGSYVILDNSAVELGGPEDFDTYLEKARYIKASEIMLPDIFQNAEATLDQAKCSLYKLGKYFYSYSSYNPDIMIIPQGRSGDEWRINALELINLVHPYCKSKNSKMRIGISARYTDLFGGNRWDVLWMGLGEGHGYHFLGCYANPWMEIRPILHLQSVVGVDSSYPSVFAKNNMELNNITLSMPRPMTKLDLINDEYHKSLLNQNINVWRSACSLTYSHSPK